MGEGIREGHRESGIGENTGIGCRRRGRRAGNGRGGNAAQQLRGSATEPKTHEL